MKYLAGLLAIVSLMSSCGSPHQLSYGGNYSDPPITQSLFADKAATISEENIQKILDGNYSLPKQLRVALIKLEGTQKRYYWNYWSDEAYLKTQQAYLDSFTAKLQQSPRVIKITSIPDMLLSKAPASFTTLRESAVRMQADVVVVYAINSDIYTKYRSFKRPDVKAFATTQLIIMDVRTGLVPFTTVVTRDFMGPQNKTDIETDEARNRVQNQAVLLTINEIGDQVTKFLSKELK
ncbi:hypothetical protein [Niastella populi]|uniref:Uncharacterized protein n=1 Tax=Niastella populi TaxID=550983 RepID=A0A1V9FPP5_9BACT|nr:hypothetical protein [Niastella populi]OQP60241.1 hypothetical protein A4R26_19990 [Niastella populi]